MKVSVAQEWETRGKQAADDADFVSSLLAALSNIADIRERGPLFAASTAVLNGGETLECATWNAALSVCGITDEENAGFQELHVAADTQTMLLRCFFSGLASRGFPFFTLSDFLRRFEE